MKRLNLVFSLVGIIVLPLFLFGSALAWTPQEELEAIKQDIPTEWWEGGWDKLRELEEFISRNQNDPNLVTQAQYYLACQYYANREHERAIQEYQKLIATYPQVGPECQKAQFEIGEIHLNRLNNPEQAIYEYEKAIKFYPRSSITAMAQLGIARAYKRLGKEDIVLGEYKALLQTYPEFKKERTQANLDIAEMLIEQALTEGVSELTKKEKLKEAITYFKQAYLICNLEDTELLEQTIDGIYSAFRCLDSNLLRANSFIKYQKYGPAGEDGISNTEDDLTDLLEEF